MVEIIIKIESVATAPGQRRMAMSLFGQGKATKEEAEYCEAVTQAVKNAMDSVHKKKHGKTGDSVTTTYFKEG